MSASGVCIWGSEARALGRGGIAAVARAAGVSRPTVEAEVAELESGQPPLGRARRAGGGSKRLADLDPALRPGTAGAAGAGHVRGSDVTVALDDEVDQEPGRTTHSGWTPDLRGHRR